VRGNCHCRLKMPEEMSGLRRSRI